MYYNFPLLVNKNRFALLAGIRKSKENLLKTPCKVAHVTKVAHIF